MDYQLLIVKGRSSSKAIQLADGVTTVGRHDDCQLRIKSSQVSRRHCEIFEKKGLLLVKDLGSSNGTFVNGTRIKDQRVLEAGDELEIGQVKLKVVRIGGKTPSTPPSAAPKAGDTAIVEANAAAAPSEDEFDIEFDEAPEVSAPASAKGARPEELAPAPAESKKAPVPDPEPIPELPVADDAVADFLFNIKLDDEES